ncbi:MAG: hypothetical protein LBQ93_04875 [Treponema sp.]|jgi:hypothetical protein|nr:hypothetical protein [Treponema sp.]
MKVLYKEEIGAHTIVKFISDVTVDSEKTKEKIAPMITDEMSKKDIERLFVENCVCSKVGPEADLIEDDRVEQIRHKLDNMGENSLLLVNGEYVADYRGVEYHIKRNGKWKKEQIDELGLSLPAGSVLQESLTKEQQQEMAAQQEAERIAGLTAEQKAEEKRFKLHALVREAITKAEEAELLEEIFDKQAWLHPRKAEIELLYA